jgi:hypothetical protein
MYKFYFFHADLSIFDQPRGGGFMNQKRKVILQPVKFRKSDHVAVISMFNPEVDEVVREIEGAEWSSGYRFWHIPMQKDTLQSLKKLLSEVCIVDATAFKNFHFVEAPQKKNSSNRKHRNFILNADQKERLVRIDKYLTDKGYSDSSIKVYGSLIKVYFSLVKDRDLFSISSEEVNTIIEEYITANSLSPNYKNLLINAIQKFYVISKG